jgi:integrase/recombinase XerD
MRLPASQGGSDAAAIRSGAYDQIARSQPTRRATPAPRPQTGMALHTLDGARKYLTTAERDAFLRAAEQADRQVRTLCMTLAYAGCRLSVDRVDLAAGQLVLESLKKRRSGVYRAVPVPPALLEALDLVHGIRELQGRAGASASGPGAA